MKYFFPGSQYFDLASYLMNKSKIRNLELLYKVIVYKQFRFVFIAQQL